MIHSLTSLRFFAALFVFLWHTNILKYYQTGYLGVSFFFLLSGFILSYNYHSKFRSLLGGEIRSFYVARFAKIYPTHLLTFLLAVPIFFLLTDNYSPIRVLFYLFQAVTNVLLIQSYFPVGFFSFNGGAWSISDEFFFYALFPGLIFTVHKYLKSTKLKLLVLFFSWLFLITVFSLFKGVRLDSWFFYAFPVTRFYDFFSGVLLGLIFVEERSFFNKLKKMHFILLEFLTFSMLFLVVYFAPHFPQSIRFSLIFIPFWGMLIFVLAFQQGIISKILSNKGLVFLGEISFAFYMVHGLVLNYTNLIMSEGILHTFLSLITTIILSAGLYCGFEEPLRKKIRGKFRFGTANQVKVNKILSQP